MYSILHHELHLVQEPLKDLKNNFKSKYFSDVVFDNPINFLKSLDGAGSYIIVGCIIYNIIMISSIFFNSTTRDKHRCIAHYLELCGKILVTLTLLVIIWALIMFILWFLLGALVNSDSFLPYAAMLGSILFVLGTLWYNYLTSRENVIKFIENNMQLLLSLALDHWFDYMNISYNSKDQTTADEKLINYRDRIRDELSDCRIRLRREWQLGRAAEGDGMSEKSEETALALNDSYKINSFIKMKKKEKLALYVLEKVSCSPNNFFYFDNDGFPRGLEKKNYFPFGARFATLSEIERYSEKVEDMLIGWDMAMFKEGIKHGPKAGYKIELDCKSGQKYNYAIIAIPKYPPAEDLEELLKLFLIFDYFNKAGDDFLSEEGFRNLYFALKNDDYEIMFDFEKQGWADICEYFNTMYDTNIDYRKGINFTDLTKIYTFLFTDLDKVYESLYQILRPDEIDDLDLEINDRISDNFSREEYEEKDEENSQFLDYSDNEEEDFDIEIKDDDVPLVALTLAEDERIQHELKLNPNARKLQFIYNHVTQENRGQVVDDLISSVSFLASKIQETHISLLSPIFGKEYVLGLPVPPSRISRLSSISPTLADDSSTLHKREDRLTSLLNLIQVEFYQELSRLFSSVHKSMFDTNNVRLGIASFFDYILPQKIQMKASRILNEQLELSKHELNTSNYEKLLKMPPKTTNQLLRQIQKYRIENDEKIKNTFAHISNGQKTIQVQLQVSLITEIFHVLNILDDSDISVVFIDIPIEGGQSIEHKLLLPHKKECQKILRQAIDNHIRSRSQHLIPEQIIPVIRSIVVKYLWFEAFQFLVRMLGINLEKDELPGGAVTIEDTMLISVPSYRQNNSFDSNSNGSLYELESYESINQSYLNQQIYNRNLKRMRSVFDQLSNMSGFLSVDLADEAILLLTDNRLNFSGVVACLQHLNIGSVRIHENGDLLKTLEALGIRSDSPVCDIDSSAAEVTLEKFDWTEFHKDPGWTPELYKAFDKLTAACPGFMGKSQIYEFVKEMSKLFQPQVSLMRRGRDRLRGRKFVHKEGITQLDAIREEMLQKSTSISNDATDSQFFPLNGECNVNLKDESMRMVSFEMFHKVSLKSGLCVSYQHSRIMWILISYELYEEIQQFLPENNVKNGLLRMYLHPTNAKGKLTSLNEVVGKVESYKGYITLSLFKKLIKKLGIQISDRGMRAIWDDLHKDPLDITDFLPDAVKNFEVPTKYLRLEMDKFGMDSTKGRVIKIESLKKQLPRLLMTGLWPESIRVLLKLSLQLEMSETHLNSVLTSMDRLTNRYGLVKPEDIGLILSNLSVEGMTFLMLREVINKMRLKLPELDVKRMFDLMDLNHDMSLSLEELLGGFQVLFGRFMPLLVLEEVGLSYEKMAIMMCVTFFALLAFFAFLGLAFSSFESLKTGISTAMQSILAVLGAVGLQSSANQEMEKVEENMRIQIEAIMGDKLSKAKEQVEELQEAIKPQHKICSDGKPMKLRYFVPKKFRPEMEDPRPCVTFYPGAHVRLEPSISGRFGRENLKWSIIPRLPEKTCLNFNANTGVIEGTIPLKDQPMTLKNGPEMENERERKREKEEKKCYGEDVTTGMTDSVGTFLKIDDYKNTGTQWNRKLNNANVGKELRMPRKTYTVIAVNSAGFTKTRITFQIQPKLNVVRGEKEATGTKTKPLLLKEAEENDTTNRSYKNRRSIFSSVAALNDVN